MLFTSKHCSLVKSLNVFDIMKGGVMCHSTVGEQACFGRHISRSCLQLDIRRPHYRGRPKKKIILAEAEQKQKDLSPCSYTYDHYHIRNVPRHNGPRPLHASSHVQNATSVRGQRLFFCSGHHPIFLFQSGSTSPFARVHEDLSLHPPRDSLPRSRQQRIHPRCVRERRNDNTETASGG